MLQNQDVSQLSLAEWRRLLEKSLLHARRFELHCWSDETPWLRLALEYGVPKPAEWEGGTVVEGPVTESFRRMLLSLDRPRDRDVYNKFTPFFSIALDGESFFEHYGTEVTLPLP